MPDFGMNLTEACRDLSNRAAWHVFRQEVIQITKDQYNAELVQTDDPRLEQQAKGAIKALDSILAAFDLECEKPVKDDENGE